VLAYYPFMVWPESIAVLVAVGLVTRRLLGLNGTRAKAGVDLGGNGGRLCRAITLELEAQCATLAVSLNEAMEESDSGQPDLAWNTLHLMTNAQWVRQAETLAVLLQAVIRHLPLIRLSLPARRLVPEFFKSEVMHGYLALHNTADQFIFRGKPRFSLHVRALDQAVTRLTADFLKAQPGPLSLPDADLWNRLDHDFHDFDLVSKETVLTVRGVIACLPAAALESFSAEVLPVLRRGVRSSGEYLDA
jgi:hypothetical protein